MLRTYAAGHQSTLPPTLSGSRIDTLALGEFRLRPVWRLRKLPTGPFARNRLEETYSAVPAS